VEVFANQTQQVLHMGASARMTSTPGCNLDTVTM
jgi:hypothetical protein